MTTCPICNKPAKGTIVAPRHVRLGADEVAEVIVCKCPPASTIMESFVDTAALVLAGKSVMQAPVTGTNVMHTGTIKPTSMFRDVIKFDMTKMPFETITTVFKTIGLPSVSRKTIHKITKGFTKIDNRMMPMKITMVDDLITSVVETARKTVFPAIDMVAQRIQNVDAGMRAFTSTYEVMETTTVVKMPTSENRTEHTIEFVHVFLEESARTISFTAISRDTTKDKLGIILMDIIGLLGPPLDMRPHLDKEFINDARSRDHIVLDVAEPPVKGMSMFVKIDGVKVFVLGYVGFAIVCQANSAMTVISIMVDKTKNVISFTTKPVIAVAEMLVDGTLVLIGFLNKGMEVCDLTIEKPGVQMPPVTLPDMLIRSPLSSSASPSETLSYMPNDGVIAASMQMTYRIKQNITVDLMVQDGKLCAKGDSSLVPIADASRTMENGFVYEFVIPKPADVADDVVLMDGMLRPTKTSPNPVDVVIAAICVALSRGKDSFMSTSVIIASSRIRSLIYHTAKEMVGNARVIVSVGAGRFQELRYMETRRYKYIAIDPDLDTTKLGDKYWEEIEETDAMRTVQAFVRRGHGVMAVRKAAEEYLTEELITFMVYIKAVFVFSFSASYCIPLINKLRKAKAMVIATCYVNADAPQDKPMVWGDISMEKTLNNMVCFKFGMSTWMEPIVTAEDLLGFSKMANKAPHIWRALPQRVKEVMSRIRILW